jgi:hypothetical protein
MNTRVAATVSVGVALLALTGCNQDHPQGEGQGSSAPTTTQPPVGSSSTVAPQPATGSPSTSSTPAPGSSTGTGGEVAPRCTTAHLKASLATSQGAAGSSYDTVRLTNTGTARCSLNGYPGVSLVGHGNGTQIGAPARRDTSVRPQSVVVRAGGSTTFVVRLVQAANYPRTACSPIPADGFRIYPPGSTAALFLPLKNATGCAKTSVDLLTVRPVGATAG